MPDIFQPDRLLVIAEAGINHNGDLDRAMRMVEAAKDCGADMVKFQTWITDKVYSHAHSLKPDYQKASTADESEYETIRRLELSFDAFHRLDEHARRVGITMLSTPDEEESADFLIDRLCLPMIKVASQDIDNLPFLRYLAIKGVPMILSTGTANIAEVAAAVVAIHDAGNPPLGLLHCVSCYPAAPNMVNLRAITTLHGAFQLPVGYSDHTIGSSVACGAVALGACILEKHFTLSRSLPGPDQQASLEPAELKAYIGAVRDVHLALGDGFKWPHPAELDNKQAMRRFAVASRNLLAGHVLRREDILLKKVVHGIEPWHLPLLVGARVRRALAADERITFDAVDLPAEPCGL